MAADITAADKWYAGEDKTLRFTIYTDDTEATCEDVSGFTLSWKLTTKPGATALLTKTGTVSGTFNATPASNTQRVTVSIADTDTDALTATTYYHELKRTDAGNEAVLAQGRATLLKPVHSS